MNVAPEQHRNTPRTPWGAWFGLLLAAVVITFAAIVWRNQRQEQTDLADINRQLAALQQAQTAAMQAQSAAAAVERKTLSDRLDGLDASLTTLRQQSAQGRETWIKAEAASLLVAANEEVQIRANPQLAIKALQQADARLKLLTDPRAIAVRQEIAREIAALNATPQPDMEGMAVTLNALADSVDQLPLKRTAPEHYAPADGARNGKAGDQPQSLWEKLKASLARLMSDMFTVHRGNALVGPLLAPKEEFFLRRNLELRLDAARAALFDHDGKSFHDSVRAAHLWLDAYFDPQNNLVKTGTLQLASMEQQSIAPALPDISASLSLLRQLEAGRNSAP